MKKKLVLFTSLLALTAVVISACQPLTQVASAAEGIAIENSDNGIVNTGSAGYGKDPGNGNEDCDGECPSTGVGDQYGGGQYGEGMTSQAPTYAIGEISEAEADGLAFMREEEKLAHDVYLTLYDQWGLRPFSNIAASEQTHIDAVKSLLEMYEITDPVTDDTIGVFANEDLQALNDQLVQTGSASLEDALKVGAAIEEIDILDLIEYLEGTEEANIEWVYGNLLAGSENHLRAFVFQLESLTGETYVPQYMPQEAYDAIISAENARGGGHGGGRRSW